MLEVCTSGGPRRAHFLRRWVAAAGLSVFLLLGQSGYSSPANSSTGTAGLKLGLVDKSPAPGRARVPLDQAVASIRHDYGRFILARFTDGQEEALRAGGYAVRVFEDPERVGLGYYSFHVPAGP